MELARPLLRPCLGLAVLAWIAFASTFVFAASGKESIPVGEFAVPKFDKPPVIDGNITDGEWDRAVRVSGAITVFSHKLMEAETTWSVGYDDERLYFLADCTRGLHEWRLGKTARENDAYSFGDPSVEIWISPPKAIEETYQNIINTFPAVMDVHNIPSRGYSAMGWTGDWTLGVVEKPDRYMIEASIPIKRFGIETIKPGDVWRILLARTSPRTQPRPQASWGVTGGFGEIPGYPKVRFAGDSPAFQVEQVMSLFTGAFDLPMAVVAPRGKGATVEVSVRVQKEVTPGDDDRVFTETVTVEAGQRKPFRMKGDLKPLTTGFVTILAKTDDGETLYRHTLPFAVGSFRHKVPTRPEGVEPPAPLSVNVMYGPENNVLLVRADIIDLPAREQALGGEVRVVDAASGKIVKTQPLPNFMNWYANAAVTLPDDLEIPVFDVSDVTEEQIAEIMAYNKTISDAKDKLKQYTNRLNRLRKQVKQVEKQAEKDERQKPKLQQVQSNLAEVEKQVAELKATASTDKKQPPMPDVQPRPLKVVVAVTDADGQALAENGTQVEVKRYKFRWQDNDIGVSDKVTPPWTPVTYDAGKVGVWNRTMGVNGLGLIESLDNGGVTDQIESMQLVAEVDGERTVIKPSAAKLDKAVEARVKLTGTGSGAGLNLSAETTVEFDGFALSELTIAPAGESAKVDKLYLEVVLPEKEATHFCTTAGGWAAIHDVTPPYWSSRQTASGLLIGDFVPYIWLTNSERAFVWLADSDKGWITDDDKSLPTQEVIRKDGKVTLRVHFIEIPTELTEATSLQYGYQTFPSRRLPDGWRATIISNSRENLPDATRTYFWFDGDWAVLWPYYCSPYPWNLQTSKELFDRFADRPDHRPMVGSIAHAIARYRDYDGYNFPELVVDWGNHPGVRTNGNSTQGKGPNDFRLYHYRRWVREAGFRGLYIDENYLGLTSNFLSGSAYIRDDGRVQRGYEYIGLRDYFMRMKTMMHNNGAVAPHLWMHISSGAAYYAWPGDFFLEGENVAATDLEYDYLKVLPAGRMRAIASSKVNGGAVNMMCQAMRHGTNFGPKHVHQFVGWVMAHDVLAEQVHWYFMLSQESRFYLPDVTFHAYWKDNNPAKVTTPGCLASMHATPGRAIVWVVNTNREDAEARLTVDLAALKLNPATTIAVDAESGEAIAIKDGALSLSVLRRDFKAVHLIDTAGARKLDDALAGELAKGLRFWATFENQRPRAAFAVGSDRFVAAGRSGEIAYPAGREGKGLAAPCQMWAHLNTAAKAGRLAFDAKLTDKNGTVLQMGLLTLRRVGKNAWQLSSDHNPIEKYWNDRPIRTKDPEKIQNVTVQAPEAGWHRIELAWADGTATLSVDGKALGTIPLAGDWAGPPTPRGPQLLQTARPTFGDDKGTIEAIDNVKAYVSP